MAMRDMLFKDRRAARGIAASPVYGGGQVVPNRLSPAERLDMLDTVEAANLGWFWATDAKGGVAYLSPGAAAQLAERKLPADPSLSDLLETVAPDGEAAGERPLGFYLASHGRITDLLVRLKGGQGDTLWLLDGRAQVADDGRFQGYRGTARDISQQFRRQREASWQAQSDELTGLANRQKLRARMDALLPALQVAKRSCALLSLDLDQFSKVNDKLGIAAGDELLRQAAQRLQRIILSPGEIARTGGDQFQVLIPDMDDRGLLGELAGKINQMLSQPYSLGRDRAVVTVSIGIAVAPYDGLNCEQLAKSADLALQAAKQDGRGQYRFFANDLASAARVNRAIGEDLRKAIEANELEMSYQPLVRAADNTVVSFAACPRWQHPQLGMVSPATFVPLAEELGLAGRLGEWTLRQACVDAAQWPGNIAVCVSVSSELFFSGALGQAVEDALSASQLRPSRLELEVTEGVFMGEGHTVDQRFARLAKRGVRLALGDFGKGYSSLASLRRAPFERIRIDQAFVRGCCDKDNPNAAIITAIVGLAGALDMQTVADGVEAMDELKAVLGHGTSLVQGFIYSRPVPQDVVLEKLSSGDFTYEPSGPEKHRAERRTVFRKVGVIHEEHRYEAVLRNLSRSGALIEGILDVPVGTDLVLDLGGGQLAVCTVRRSQDATQGVEFETPLISDGARGLCTRHRVSPYQLAAAGMPLEQLGMDTGARMMAPATTRRRFMQLDVSAGSHRAA